MNRQTRRIGSDVRATEDADGNHYITLRAITPGVVDDYGSVWRASTFDRALGERMPTLAWGHDWKNPIGRAVSHEASDEGPSIKFRLDDFDAVPEARRAFAQVGSGTIDDCSVGFSNVTRRTRSEMTKEERDRFGEKAVEIIDDADLDEVSLVLRGAVPGAKVLAVRSAGGARGSVDQSLVIELAQKVTDGEISREAALEAVTLAAALDPTPPAEAPLAPAEGGEGELEAEIDNVLEDVGRSRF